MPTYDGDSLTITLDSGAYQVDMADDLYTSWKDWMLSSPENRGYPQAFDVVGGDELSPIINAGSYFFLRNDLGWRIKPFEEDGTWWFNGNLAPRDSAAEVFKKTTGSYNTQILGLQPITQGITPAMGVQLEHGSFLNSSVWIDSTNGHDFNYYFTAGVHNPGSRQYPLISVPEALIVASTRGFDAISFIGSLTVGTGVNVSGFTITGQSPSKSTLTILADATAVGCEIYECKVTGTLDGGSEFRMCVVEDIYYINGYMYNCLIMGTVQLAGGTPFFALDCKSGIDIPTIDMGGSGQGMAIKGFDGTFNIINKTGSDYASIDLAAGAILLDPTTVTGGDIEVHGDGCLKDSVTDEYIYSGNWNGATIINHANSPIAIARETLTTDTSSITDNNTLGGAISHLKHLEYKIFIDSELVDPPIEDGSQHYPYSDETAAIDYAETYGVLHLQIKSDIDLTRNVKNFYITSTNIKKIDTNTWNLEGSRFSHIELTGNYTGYITAQDCSLTGGNLCGFFQNCAIGSDFIIPDLSNVFMKDCAVFTEGFITPPSFDIGGVSGTAKFHNMNYYGGCKIINCNQSTDEVKIAATGQVVIDSTCTDGNIIIFGLVKPIDNSGIGCNVMWYNIDPIGILDEIPERTMSYTR